MTKTIKIYTIKLEADLKDRGVYYVSYWDGQRFSSVNDPWAVYNNPVLVQVELEKVRTYLKPES